MKKTHSNPLFLASTLLALMTAFSGCSKEKFSAVKEDAGAGPEACVEDLKDITVPVKMLFVVDTSGSNANATNYTGTDNNKVVRGQSIQQFFNQYRTKTNFRWGFNVFSGTDSTTLIGASSNQPAFTNLTSIMQQAISNFFNIADAGQTPYNAALNLVKTAIDLDTVRTAQTKWIILFMSDGVPNPDVSVTALANKVSSIVSLIPGQISFNTVYYGPADAQATARLEAMAAAGGGKFLNTNNNGRSFPIEDVITVPGNNCSK